MVRPAVASKIGVSPSLKGRIPTVTCVGFASFTTLNRSISVQEETNNKQNGVTKGYNKRERLHYICEGKEGQAPTPVILIQKSGHLVSALEIVAADPHMHQKLFWVGVDGDAVGIYGLRIIYVVRPGVWALIL